MLNFNDLIGKPFKDGGRGPDVYDCWGLTREIFKRYGYDLPDYQISSSDPEGIAGRAGMDLNQNISGPATWKKEFFLLPDKPYLVTFQMREPGKITHVGTYIGDGRVIHILEGKTVSVERVSKYQNFIEGYYEFKN
jgi:cell wall-associated NlpC family hydrolase